MTPSASQETEGPLWDAPSAFFTFQSEVSRDAVLSALKQQDALASGLPGGSQAMQACPDILEVGPASAIISKMHHLISKHS